MTQLSGSAVFNLQEDEELTEQEQLELLEKQRQNILNVLSTIESKPNPSKSEVADHVRYTSYLGGDESLAKIEDDDKIIQLAKGFGNPMVDKIYNPGFFSKDYARSLKWLANDFVKNITVGSRAVVTEAFSNNQKVYSPYEDLSTLNDITTPQDITNQFPKTDTASRYLSVGGPGAVSTYDEEVRPDSPFKPQIISDPYTIQETEDIRKRMLFKFPERPDQTQAQYNDEINFRVSRFKETGATLDSKATLILRKGLEDTKKLILENPQYMADMEWLSENFQTIDNTREVAQWVGKLTTNVGLSQATNIGMGTLGAKSGVLTGGTLFGPGGAVVGGTIGYMTASGVSSGAQMSGATLRGEFERLTEDSYIDERDYQTMMKTAKEHYNKKKGTFFHKGLGRNTNAAELLDLYEKTTFVKTKDGIVLRGLSDDEALEATIGTAYLSGGMGVLIEQISEVARIAKYIPGVDKILPAGLQKNFIKTFNDKISKRARLIPIAGVKNRVKRWALEEGINLTGRMAAEGTEEVLQGVNDALASTYTPYLAEEGLLPGIEKMYYKPTNYSDHHEGWTQFRDEFFGLLERF